MKFKKFVKKTALMGRDGLKILGYKNNKDKTIFECIIAYEYQPYLYCETNKLIKNKNIKIINENEIESNFYIMEDDTLMLYRIEFTTEEKNNFIEEVINNINTIDNLTIYYDCEKNELDFSKYGYDYSNLV